ncbi:hypothetical protein CEXT_675861 [Caerostris extrusa]|uniref:Uncharacterized protein n=1 Tax=Caerostris extrusa TaxID=172846 RepID=A0AAV4XDX0_CAEEX|nr:hypothetical protein CEXT_675861 [Caerostris extrusa]
MTAVLFVLSAQSPLELSNLGKYVSAIRGGTRPESCLHQGRGRMNRIYEWLRNGLKEHRISFGATYRSSMVTSMGYHLVEIGYRCNLILCCLLCLGFIG